MVSEVLRPPRGDCSHQNLLTTVFVYPHTLCASKAFCIVTKKWKVDKILSWVGLAS